MSTFSLSAYSSRGTHSVYVNGELVDTVLDCGVNLDPKFVKISSCEGILLSEVSPLLLSGCSVVAIAIPSSASLAVASSY